MACMDYMDPDVLFTITASFPRDSWVNNISLNMNIIIMVGHTSW